MYNHIALGAEKTEEMILVSLHLLRLALSARMWSVVETVLGATEKNMYSVSVGQNIQ